MRRLHVLFLAIVALLGLELPVEAAPIDLGYGPNLFYFLRHDNTNFSTFGTIAASGAITDRFGVGSNFDALTFAQGPDTPIPEPETLLLLLSGLAVLVSFRKAINGGRSGPHGHNARSSGWGAGPDPSSQVGTMRGIPPSSGLAPASLSSRRLGPPCPTRSWNTLVGRR